MRVYLTADVFVSSPAGATFIPLQRALKDYLNQEFRDLIQVNEQRDRVITGNFEVTIVNANGVKVIHSKRRGMGYANTAQSRQAIVEQIKEALEAV